MQDDVYRRWIGVVRDCIEALDENYRFRYLPCDGGLYNQDEWIIEIWRSIRNSYIVAMKDTEIRKVIDKNAKS